VNEERPILDYLTSGPRPKRGYKILDILAILSLTAGVAIIALSVLGLEVQLNDPATDCWPHVVFPLYHNGFVYCLDPFWMASFALIIPLIWLKRKAIETWRSRRKSS
jgi:hypothetical protein